MALFAVGDTVWLGIIGLIGLVVKDIIDQRRADRATAKMQALTLAASAETARQIEVVAGQVEVVHKATNSLTDQLVDKTEREALARGGVEERARAEARDKNPQG